VEGVREGGHDQGDGEVVYTTKKPGRQEHPGTAP